MPAVQEKVEEPDRARPAPRRQPRRGRRDRRRHPGRRAQGRGQGRAAPRRHPAVAGHRDQGRRLHEADRAQHDDPDAEVRDLLDRRGRPAVRRDPRAPGRARDGRLQQDPGQVPARRHRAGAARRAADRGHLRHRCQRHHARVRQGQWAPATSRRSRSRAGRASPTPRSTRWCATPSRTPRTTARLGSWPRRGTAAEQVAYSTEKSLAEHDAKLDDETKTEIRTKIDAVKQAIDSDDVGEIRVAPRGAARGLVQAGRAGLPAGPAVGHRRRRQRRRRRRGATRATRRSWTPRSSTRPATARDGSRDARSGV